MKKTQGRKKIEMKMISNKNARRITFSKRKNGIFKKACELATLCATEIVVIIFSIGGKAFSFGYPSVDHVINRFLDKSPQLEHYEYTPDQTGSSRWTRILELTKKGDELNKRLEAEKKRKKIIEKSIENLKCKVFGKNVEELALHELMQLKTKLENLKENLGRKGSEMHVGAFENNYGDVDSPKSESKEDGVSSVPYDWLKL